MPPQSAGGRPTWLESFLVYRKPVVVSLAFLGFSAGLPYLLVFSTLTAWLRDEGVSRSAIGFFAWVGMMYSIKVVWAPFVDRLKLPWLDSRLGRRRSWMLVAQVGIMAALLGMSWVGSDQLTLLAILALAVAFSSATQDIAIDAYRIERCRPPIFSGIDPRFWFRAPVRSTRRSIWAGSPPTRSWPCVVAWGWSPPC